MTAQKFDSEKPPMDLIDPDFAVSIPYATKRLEPGQLLDLAFRTCPDNLEQVEALVSAVRYELCFYTLAGDEPPATDATWPLWQLAKVLGFGAHKYAPNNWRKGLPRARVWSAALRHIYAWARGEVFDLETGLPHLAHALCELMFLWRFVVDGLDLPDDRFVKAAPRVEKTILSGCNVPDCENCP
jgi:hypothetical protein